MSAGVIVLLSSAGQGGAFVVVPFLRVVFSWPLGRRSDLAGTAARPGRLPG